MIKFMRKTFGKILLVIFIGLLINKPLFLHTHILPDGSVIVHSHPYKIKNLDFSTTPNHKHSNHEIKLINWLNSYNDRYLFNNCAELDFRTEELILRKFVLPNFNILENYHTKIYKRGPPAA